MSGNNNEQVNGTIYPVSHSGLSASSTTLSSAAGGGLLGSWSGFKKGGAIGAVVGAVILGSITAGIASIFTAALPAIGAAALIGALPGGVLGAFEGFGFGGFVGAIDGMIKGGARGTDKVHQERALSVQVQNEFSQAATQTQAVMAQAQALQHQNAARSHVGQHAFPAQGSAMNPASPKINASDITEHARVAELELQKA
jgi:hypothetical protein